MVVLIALAVRLVRLDYAPHFDEFYHLLAAQSLLQDGDLCIAECLSPYGRGAPFTYLVAGAMGLFGGNMIAARLASVLAGILLVAGVFWWTWRIGGRTAAVAAGFLLAVSPEAIYVSQLVRFYAWHALLVWIGAAALFLAVHDFPDARPPRRWALAGIALLALWTALSLQITTLIAGVGIGVWLLLDPGARWARQEGGKRPGRVVTAASGLAALTIVGLFAMERTGILADLWARYRSANLHHTVRADDIRYYHRFLMDSYPTFYSLLPAAFVVALWKRPAAALFTGSMFGVALVLHSGGGFKGSRFVFYAMPFFFALWGIALGVVLPPLAEGARQGVARWLRADPAAAGARTGGGLLLVAAAFCVLATNTAYNTTLKMLTVSDAEWPASKPMYRGRPDWRPALPMLRELAQGSDVVVTTASTKALYYLDRSDAALSVSLLFTGSGFAPDFAVDPRMGDPVINSPEAVDRLVRCYRSGLVVVETHAWSAEWGVPPETAAYIAANTEEVELPPGSDVRAFRWRSDTTGPAEACDPPPLANPPEARATG